MASKLHISVLPACILLVVVNAAILGTHKDGDKADVTILVAVDVDGPLEELANPFFISKALSESPCGSQPTWGIGLSTKPKALPGVKFTPEKNSDGRCPVFLLCRGCSAEEKGDDLMETLNMFENISMGPQRIISVPRNISFPELSQTIHHVDPLAVVVYGDGEFASLVALTSYQLRIKVLALQVGLRSGFKRGRTARDGSGRTIAALASVTFPFTLEAYEQLRHEKLARHRVRWKGDPTADTLKLLMQRASVVAFKKPESLVFVHLTHWYTDAMLFRIFNVLFALGDDHRELEIVVDVSRIFDANRETLLNDQAKQNSLRLVTNSSLLTLKEYVSNASWILTDADFLVDGSAYFNANVVVLVTAIKPHEQRLVPEFVLGTLLSGKQSAKDLYEAFVYESSKLKSRARSYQSARGNATFNLVAEIIEFCGTAKNSDSRSLPFVNEHVDRLHDDDMNTIAHGVQSALHTGEIFVVIDASNSTYGNLVHQLHLAELLDTKLTSVLLYNAYAREQVDEALSEYPEILYLTSNSWELPRAGIVSFALLSTAEHITFLPPHTTVSQWWLKKAVKSYVELGAVVAECGTLLHSRISGTRICSYEAEDADSWQYIEVDSIDGAFVYSSVWSYLYWSRRSYKEDTSFGMNFCGSLHLSSNIRCFVQVPIRKHERLYNTSVISLEDDEKDVISRYQNLGWVPVLLRDTHEGR